MAKERPNLSMRISEQLKADFKHETFMQGVDMTETIESFMIKYVEVSKKARDGKAKG